MPAPQNRSHTSEDLNDGILSYLSTTFHKYPYRQISFFIAIFFLFSLLLFSSDVIASESPISEGVTTRFGNSFKKISPPPSSYRPADLRKSSHQVRFLEKSPIDYKERDLGSQEAKGSFQGSVRPRSEDLNLLPVLMNPQPILRQC